MQIVREYVDILLANEDEARAFTGFSDEERAISALAEKSRVAVLKVGKKGELHCRPWKCRAGPGAWLREPGCG